MEIIVGKTAGFCFGVENAVTKAEKELEIRKPVYCLGELVHNRQVVEDLTKKGIVFIDDIKDAKGKVIIRSHGVSKEIYEVAKAKNVELVDLTCPKVLKIHEIAEKYAADGYYILLVGQAGHDEIIGTASYCGEYFSLIEEPEDVKIALEKLEKTEIKNIALICQTTFNLEKFNKIADIVEKELSKKNLEVINTVCSATKERQDETKEIAKACDFMVIIGGRHSSNTRKLYEISRGVLQKCCTN